MTTALVIVLALVLAAEFINGWTDAPNAIATVVSTGSLPPRVAIVMAAVLNALGAYSGTEVAKTVGKGIVTSGAITLPALAAAMVSIVAWGVLASHKGWPISKSHALLAGIAGAGLASGFNVLSWNIEWLYLLPDMVVLLWTVLALLTLLAVITTTLRSGWPLANPWHLGLHFMSGFAGAALAAGLVYHHQVLWQNLMSHLIPAFSGILLAEGWWKVAYGLFASLVIGFVLTFLVGTAIRLANNAFARNVSPARMGRIYDLAHVATSATVAFAHGLNDGQKFIGVFTLALVLGGVLPQFAIQAWVIVLCSLTMGLGTMCGGWKIIATIGKKMGDLASWQGCAATSSAAATIIFASQFGIPLSTTHTISSSIAGALGSRRVSAIRLVVVRRIMLAWVMTFPCCGALAFVAALLAHQLFH